QAPRLGVERRRGREVDRHRKGGENRRMARFAMAGPVAVALVLLIGCGSSQNQADLQWLREVERVERNMDAKGAETVQKVGAAIRSGNPDQIAAGFASYEVFLAGSEQKLKDTDPPEQCRAISQAVVGYVEQARSEAQQLSSSEAVDTRAELL